MSMDTGGFGGDDRRRLLIPAAIGGVVVLLLLLLGIAALIRSRSGGGAATATPTRSVTPLVLGTRSPTAAVGLVTRTTAPIPTTGGQVSAPPTATPAVAAPAAAKKFVVSGTSGDGVRLRRTASATGEQLGVFEEGTQLEQIGPDVTAEGRAWRHVRGPAPDSLEGFVAAEFTAAVP